MSFDSSFLEIIHDFGLKKSCVYFYLKNKGIFAKLDI